jgi:dipeptidyl-peptidase III
MKKHHFLIVAVIMLTTFSCSRSSQNGKPAAGNFNYFVDQFEDIRVLKYQLPNFDSLSLNQKKLIYFLSEAALAGRDILWDQNFRYNLVIRKTLEAVVSSYKGNREEPDFKAFLTYSKRVFFANGIHHHYSQDKFKPGFGSDYFAGLVRNSDPRLLPLDKGMGVESLLKEISPVMFDESLYSKKVELRGDVDIVAASAVNFYDGVTQKEVEGFYAGKVNPKDPRPVSTGLNSKIINEKGHLKELVYKSGGLYGQAIDRIIYWLDKAKEVAENESQKKELDLLIAYYRSGDLKDWDNYNVEWAGNVDPVVDYINGFIESYEDPLGVKATWESIIDYKDPEATRRTETITANAQWFEDNSPADPKYRKEKVTGVAAKVINIAMLGGDCFPASPLGINLPNADWIRKEVGSKSVTLANITDAYDNANRGSGFLQEFAAFPAETERSDKYLSLADALHTDLHECIGHASGKLAEGTDPNALKNYQSTLEEARADLFGLYFIMDKKMVELKLIPDEETAKAEYDSFIRNGLLTQLVRIKPGKDIEESHMRDRAVISRWVYEKGLKENVIELFRTGDKTYVKINHYKKLKALFGELLKEIQRIKSEGDYEAGKALVEGYGVKVDPVLHKEILERYERLHLAPYTGFVNPVLRPVTDQSGNITDIRVEYQDDFLKQMLQYGKDYSFLPARN